MKSTLKKKAQSYLFTQVVFELKSTPHTRGFCLAGQTLLILNQYEHVLVSNKVKLNKEILVY